MLQAKVLSAFEQMAKDGMERFHPRHHAGMLLPSEVCFLIAEGVLPPQQADNDCVRMMAQWKNDASAQCSPLRTYVAHAPPCFCWPHKGNNYSRPATCSGALPMSLRPSLYSMFPIATSTTDASHLNGVVEVDRHLVLVGDSLIQEIWRAAKCELSRTGRISNADQIHAETFGGLRKQYGHHHAVAAQQLQVLNRIKKLRSNNSTRQIVVVLSLGAHYNTKAQDRAMFVADLKSWMALLDRFVSGCSTCAALFLTTHSQHFMTDGGAYADEPDLQYGKARTTPQIFIPGGTSARAETFYGCSTTLPKSAWPGNATSANQWRAEEAMEILQRFPRVLLVPLHRTSRLWGDAHLGMMPELRCAQSADGRCKLDSIPWQLPEDRFIIADCTHFCPSPFLYQPVWWAIRQAVDSLTH